MVMEVIDVFGRREPSPGPLGPLPGSGVFPDTPTGSPLLPRSEAFVAPPLVPVLEEIIVTASRPAASTSVGAGAGALRGGIAGLFALIGGVIIAKIFEKLGDEIQDEAFQLNVERGTPRVLPDTPLQLMEEIVVTEPAALRVAPQPEFFPFESDPDPFIMIPLPTAPQVLPSADPVRIAEPAPLPEIELPGQPVTRPLLPLPLRDPLTPLRPLVAPLPFGTPLPLAAPLPLPLPIGAPSPSPTAQPQPFAQPAAQPQPSTRPRSVPIGFASPLTQTLPQPLTGPELARPGNCPPCPRETKDEPELRTQCFKKMVIESTNPEFDESFNWNEVDCITGRDL